MTKSKGYPDSLLERVLKVLQQRMDPSWIESKRQTLHGKTRLDVLDWIACSLDGANKVAVAEDLELHVQDLQSLQRVLQKTRWV